MSGLLGKYTLLISPNLCWSMNKCQSISKTLAGGRTSERTNHAFIRLHDICWLSEDKPAVDQKLRTSKRLCLLYLLKSYGCKGNYVYFQIGQTHSNMYQFCLPMLLSLFVCVSFSLLHLHGNGTVLHDWPCLVSPGCWRCAPGKA